jgi:hypothetical protein
MTCNTSKFKPFNQSEATQSVRQHNIRKISRPVQIQTAMVLLKINVEVYKENEANITIFSL